MSDVEEGNGCRVADTQMTARWKGDTYSVFLKKNSRIQSYARSALVYRRLKAYIHDLLRCVEEEEEEEEKRREKFENL